jgi:hypothetical protein
MFVWILVIPYFLGLIAAIDNSGSLVAFRMAMQTTGLSIGQALSALSVGRAAVSNTIFTGILMAICAMATALVAVILQARQ